MEREPGQGLDQVRGVSRERGFALERGLNEGWWVLRLGLGLMAFLAGLDKFFNLLAHWEGYLSPAVSRLVPLSPPVFMDVVGIIEMVVGLCLLFTRYTRAFAYIVMIWLLGIAANLIIGRRFFDVAVRDIIIALAAFTLAKLSEHRLHVHAGEPVIVAPDMRPVHGHA